MSLSILDRLASKHSDAVFVSECKTGSSWNGCRRLDAWALLKTWSPPTIIGYEIKTDRSDFLRDRKWQEYLPVCHELYFACPAKLIAPEELPQDVGLLWTSGESRLVTKRKAVRREPDPVALVRLMTYVLMSRTRIVNDMHAAAASAADRWRDWLTDREGERLVGHMVGRRIRSALDDARRGQREAEERAKRYQQIEERLTELGLDPNQRLGLADLEGRFGNPRAAGALRRLRQMAGELERVASSGLEKEA